jgi:hypothetical protein
MTRPARRPAANEVTLTIQPDLVPTSRTVAREIRQFQALLDARAAETAVHAFLATHLHFWNGLLRIGNNLYSKVRLGAEYEVDFIFCDPSSSGAEWHLIEIEAPAMRLFTRRGDPSRELTRSLTQVRDWQRWIERNIAYARQLLPGIDHPMGHVFMGRRGELLDARSRERLRAINVQYRAHVQVHTLDRFVDMAMTTLTGRPGRIRRRALSHSQLQKGLRPEMIAFIESPVGQLREFVADRRHRRLNEENARQIVEVPRFVEVSTIVSKRASNEAKPRR